MSDHSRFIESVRLRYLSGLLIFAITCGAMNFALRYVNDFRHEVDEIENELVELTTRLEKATDFAAEVARELLTR